MALRAVIGATRPFPYKTRVAILASLTRNIILAIPAMRRRIHDNLSLIFPDMEQAEKRRIARCVAGGVGRHVMETFSTEDFTKLAKSTPISGPGLAALEAAQKSGRGVIILSGHFGNWELARFKLAAMGHIVAGIYRPQNNPYFETDFRAALDALGAPIFAKGPKGMRDMLRHLKGGGITAVLLDQRDTRGETLDFMGHPAKTPTAIAELARRNGFALIPLYATRQADSVSFEIELEEEIPATTAQEMTQAFNASLGARIRAHPEQWLWLHRRWKL